MEPESEKTVRKPRQKNARRNNKAKGKKTSRGPDDKEEDVGNSQSAGPSSAGPLTGPGAPDQDIPSAGQAREPSASDDRGKSSDPAAGLGSSEAIANPEQQAWKKSSPDVSMEVLDRPLNRKQSTTQKDKAKEPTWWDPKDPNLNEVPPENNLDFRHGSYPDASHIFGQGKPVPMQSDTSSKDQAKQR